MGAARRLGGGSRRHVPSKHGAGGVGEDRARSGPAYRVRAGPDSAAPVNAALAPHHRRVNVRAASFAASISGPRRSMRPTGRRTRTVGETMAKQTRSTKSADAGSPEGKARRREAARLERARKKVEAALKDARAELGRRNRQVAKAEKSIGALEARLAKSIAEHAGAAAATITTAAEGPVAAVKAVLEKTAAPASRRSPSPKPAAKPAAKKPAARTATRSATKPAAAKPAAKPAAPKPAAKAAAPKTAAKPATKAAASKPATRKPTTRKPASSRRSASSRSTTSRPTTRPRSRRSPQAGADGGGSTGG